MLFPLVTSCLHISIRSLILFVKSNLGALVFLFSNKKRIFIYI